MIGGIVFLIIAVIAGLVNECQAQDRAIIKSDTLKYKGHSFYKGQVITLGYGSAPNKDFIFILLGSGLTATGAAPATLSNWQAEVEKVQKAGGKNYIKAKLTEMPKLGVSTIVIDAMGAIDNNELKLD